MIELSAGRALGALLLATVGGPIAYLILLVGAGLGLGLLFDDGVLPVGVLAVLTFALPIACGIGPSGVAGRLLNRRPA